MSFDETTPFDYLIWDPDIIGLLRDKFPDSAGSPVTTLIEDTRKKKLIERQPKPIDSLIEYRDSIIASFAKKWLELNDERTPLQFVQAIWNPMREAIFDRDFDGETTEEFAQRVIPIEIRDMPSGVTVPLALGLISCLRSMVTLDSGEVENTIFHLATAASYRVALDEASRQRGAKSVVHIDFAQLGASAKNKENRAMKAEAMAHYAKNKHLFSSMEKAAQAIAGKIVPVEHRTVIKWLSSEKKKKLNPGALQE